MSKCLGCGITLQNTKEASLGYTPKLDNKYCQRCFKTLHYNKETKVDNIDNDKIINRINKLNYFTIFVTDFLNLKEEVISKYQKIKTNKILVINKCDIIPSNLKLEHLKANIKSVYQIADEVIFISAKQKKFSNYLEQIIAFQKRIVFCGASGSGKSTLINSLFKTNVLTSKYENTTLDFIKIKNDDCLIYDTPGLSINNTISNNKIKVITRSLKPNYVLSLADIKIRGKGNITLFIDGNTSFISKKEDINLEYQLKINKDTDILFKGGFIFLKDGDIAINKPLEIRDSIIK